MTHKNINIANKFTGLDCKIYTLNGIERGMIQGRLLPFAKITSLDSGLSFEVNWPLVERKMSNGDKTFYSC